MHKSKRNRKYRKNRKDRKLSKKLGGGFWSSLTEKAKKATNFSNKPPSVTNESVVENPMFGNLTIAQEITNTNSVKNLGNEQIVNTTPVYTKEEQNILNKQKKAAGILNSIESKNELNILFMINCCVLYNVYIDVDTANNTNETIQLYQEELKNIGKELDDIFNNVRNILNDFFMTKSFGKSHYLFDDTKKSEETTNFDKIIQDLTKPIVGETVEIKQSKGTAPEVQNPDVVIDKLKEEEEKIEDLAEQLIETDNERDIEDNNGEQIGGGDDIEQAAGNDSNPVKTNTKIMEVFDIFFNDIKEINIIEPDNDNLLQQIKIEGNSFKYLLFVYLFIYKIRTLYKEALNNIKPTDEIAKKIMYQAKVVMAKQKLLNELKSTKEALKSVKKGALSAASYMGKSASSGLSKSYNAIKNFSYKSKGGSKRRTMKKKIGGGLLSNTLTTFSHIPTMAYQVISERDPKIKEKYTYLFYFNSFLTMYKDNLLVSRSIQEGDRGMRDVLRDSLLGAYRFAKKNPMLALFYGTLTIATQVIFYASIVYPPLVPFAAGLTLTHKIVSFVILPIAVPAAIALYKSSEIQSYNNSMISIIGSEFTESRIKQIQNIEKYLLSKGIQETSIPEINSKIAENEKNLLMPTSLPAADSTTIPPKIDEEHKNGIKKKIIELRYNKLKELQNILAKQSQNDKNIQKYKKDIDHFINKYTYQNSVNDLIFKYRNSIQNYLLSKTDLELKFIPKQ
jgi:hypothetical protein